VTLGTRLALWGGIAAALIGLLFLFIPVSADAGVSCGNVFAGGPDSGAFGDTSGAAACSAARVDRWQYSVPLLVLGGIAAWASEAKGRPEVLGPGPTS